MNYYDEIKNELVNNEINRKVKSYSINRSDLNAYYNVGKMLSEAGKHYGEGIIKEYSKRLKNDLQKNYSIRLLYRMLKYYNFVTSEKMPTLSAKISWSHYDEVLKYNDINKINYYLNIVEEQNLSVRKLRTIIKSNEYERLDEKTRNKLINKERQSIVDFVKNPIIIKNKDNDIKDLIKNPILIKNKYHYENISEKVLQKLILEDIESFMKELGKSFSFIGSEYKILLGTTYNYIDLLLFNIEYNCYVVIELKVTELRKEHVGQIQVYMNYIDQNIRKINQDKTIGIIICRENNEYVIKYCSDNRIITREYEIV